MIIDAQVHAYERNRPERPWLSVPNWPPEVNADQMVAAMDAVGVDGAINISPFSLYGYDASFARAVHARYPRRLALIKPVDPADPGVADTIADWATTPGAVAVRIMLTQPDVSRDPADPGITRVLQAAARHRLPVNLLIWGRIEQAEQIAARNADTAIVIDHLGLPQPRVPPAPPAPWAALPSVLRLATYANVSIKVSGACTLSHQTFPFNDIWEPLARVFDAFGFDRCMWGTDWTRAAAVVDYKPAVDAFLLSNRLTAGDRDKLMGGSLTRIYNWTPTRP